MVCGERLDEAEATLILPVIPVDRDKGQSWAGDQTQVSAGACHSPSLGKADLKIGKCNLNLLLVQRRMAFRVCVLGEDRMLWKEDIN